MSTPRRPAPRSMGAPIRRTRLWARPAGVGLVVAIGKTSRGIGWCGSNRPHGQSSRGATGPQGARDGPLCASLTRPCLRPRARGATFVAASPLFTPIVPNPAPEVRAGMEPLMHTHGSFVHRGPAAGACAISRREFLRGGLALGAGVALSRVALDAWEPVIAQAAEAQLPPVTQFLKQEQVAELIKLGLARGAGFAEVYGEYTINTTFVLDENELRQLQYGVLSGVGVRVIDGETVGYAYADEFGMAGLREAATVAAAIAARSTPGTAKPFAATKAKAPFVLSRPAPLMATESEKIDLCRRANDAARAKDPRIQQVQVILADSAKAILVANSEGTWAEDRQFISRLAVQPTAIDGTNRQTGIAMAGGAVEADYFTKVRTPEETANEAADTAIALLTAIEAKAGSYPVII